MVAIRQFGEDMNFERVFEEELLPHADALYNFAYHLTYNDHDAADLVQETYLKAHRAIRTYVVGTNAKAWLFRILKNTFINDYRSKSRRPGSVELDEARTLAEVETIEYTSADFGGVQYRDILGDEVATAVDSLPEDFRVVFLLCDMEDFSYEDISKILNIPIGTVRSRLHRGRNALKAKLMEYAVSMGYKE
jgi:RNA polymerase sigma factor (sigma-70 family)